MALQVGELYAKMSLNDAEFKRKLQDAEKQMADVAKKASAAFAAIAGSITAAAIAASNYAGEAQALAGQTGLATEAVQALGYAARRSDADLDLLGRGMRSLVRRAAEAAQGNQGLADNFAYLGLETERLTELLRDPEQLLLEVADAISKLPTEAQASAAAMNVMSDSGRRLVPFLRQGSAGIRELMTDAERLGLVMGGRAIADLNRFGDEVGILQERVAALTRTVAVEALPTIRSVISVLDDAITRVQSMDAGTRRLIGTVGAGTVGAVGSFAALSTAIWGASRALRALGSVLALSTGPAGWFVLAGIAATSLAVGLSLAEQHARRAAAAVHQFATLGEVQAELERVQDELREATAEMEALQRQWTTPVRGGPQMTFEAARAGEDPLAERIGFLKVYIEELEQQRDTLQSIEDQQNKMMEEFESALSRASATESQAYQRWQKDIEAVQRQMELFTEELYLNQELLDAAVDQAQFRRAVEEETVQLLRRELDLQRSIVEATQSALNASSLLPEETEELTHQLALAEASVGRLEKELRQAEETLRLADYASPFERLGHLANLFRLQLETGVRPADEIMERVNEILNSMDDLNDGTVTYLRTLREWKMLAEQVQNAMPEPLTPVRPGAPVGPTPTITRDQARIEELADAFGRLELRVDASVVPMEDAIAKLHEMRSEIIRMAAASGGLANANEEQIRLYNHLTRALERWMESLETLPTRMEEIRAEMERALGVGMAVEREIARATGGQFDELAYEMDVLQQAIRSIASEVGNITPETEELIQRLRELAREHESLATTEAMVRTALDSLGRNLGPVGRAITNAIGFKPGEGFSFDTGSFAMSAIGLAVDALFGASGGLEGSARALESAAEALQEASHSWQQTLSDSQLYELLEATPADLIAGLESERAALEYTIRRLEERWVQFWNAGARKERIRELEDTIREINKTIAELDEGWQGDIEQRMSEILGVTTRSLQNAVSSAFGASTAEDFAANIEDALTGRVRNAFVTAFLESATMAPLFESLGDQIREALLDVDISPDEMEGIREIMEEIKARSAPLYDLLSEMGLLADVTERVNNEFARLVNMPMGFRALQTLRFQSATPQVVPALVGAGGNGANGGNVYIEHISLPNVSNAQEFERDMRRLQRRDGLRRAGNPTAMRRLR